MDSSQLSQLPGWALPILMVVVIWSLFWKGAALWQAARKGDGAWFVILLPINTIGILEIIYLFGVAKVKTNKLFR
jgi:methionyl-tRNA synthetase